jgi:threonine dehydratase
VSAPAGAEDVALVTLRQVQEAAARLEGVALRTPLLPGELPDGSTVWLKCESLQRAGAFKVRGAYNFVSCLSPAEREAGLVAYSSGNHAQGVAWAARAFGIPATIVMPVDAPAVKVEGTRRLGARVVQAGTTAPEREARAREIQAEEGATMVPPFDHPDIIAGQGTTALEIWDQLDEAAARDEGAEGDPGLVLAPIGGGGLLSGCAVVLRELAPECRIVGVEPEGAADMKLSLEAGEPVKLDRVDTIADGLRPPRPGDLTFAHTQELVDEVVTVPDEAIVEAVLWCFRHHLVVEPSGAASVAALLCGAVDPGAAGPGDVTAVLSGGNIDPHMLAGWLEELPGGRAAGGSSAGGA